jgi:hypothetical protein
MLAEVNFFEKSKRMRYESEVLRLVIEGCTVEKKKGRRGTRRALYQSDFLFSLHILLHTYSSGKPW